MNKSIRNFALTIAVLFTTAAPSFANRMGTNPHPQLVSVDISVGDYLGIVLSVAGL
jgi:hypothetical protein